jgi:hypothetical protein
MKTMELDNQQMTPIQERLLKETRPDIPNLECRFSCIKGVSRFQHFSRRKTLSQQGSRTTRGSDVQTRENDQLITWLRACRQQHSCEIVLNIVGEEESFERDSIVDLRQQTRRDVLQIIR